VNVSAIWLSPFIDIDYQQAFYMSKVSLAQTNSLAAQIPAAPVAGEAGCDGVLHQAMAR
jgi:hypothetical protein